MTLLPATLLPDAHPDLRALVADALAAASDVLGDEGVDFQPFWIATGPGGGRLEVIPGWPEAKVLREARHRLARTEGLEVAALVDERPLDHEGQRGNAVFVEAHRAGEPRGVRVAQRILDRFDQDAPRALVGEPVHLGDAVPLIRGAGVQVPEDEAPDPAPRSSAVGSASIFASERPRRGLFRRRS